MRDDLKAAVRSLRSSPAFTAVALLVLTLGVGASTAIFSVVDAVVLRGLPFDEHDRLVAVGERRPPAGNPDPDRDPLQLSSVAPQNWLDWAAEQQVFDAFAAIANGGITLQEPGAEPEDLRAQWVTAAFFDVLRVRPLIGRAFTADAEVDGRHRVVVLSDALWRRRFGGDTAIVGRTIPLNGEACEVIGIMPPGMTYPVGSSRGTELWLPYVIPANERVRAGTGFSLYLQTIGRLKPGVSLEQAQAQMTRIAAAIEKANPEWNRNSTARVRPLRDHLVGAQTRSWMLMLLGAVGIVLVIACANVASLLLARASARGREMAVRAALGASRWRLVRQLMIESLVLSIAGTLLSIVVAWWAVQILKTAMPEGVPRVAAIALNVRVLAAAASAALMTGILFGIVPAFQTSRPDLTKALKDDARGSVGAGRQRLRGALVVGEVALAVVLLVGSALFIGSFVTVMRIDPGFDPDHVLIAQLLPPSEPGKPPADARAAFEQIVERIAQSPGAVHASIDPRRHTAHRQHEQHDGPSSREDGWRAGQRPAGHAGVSPGAPHPAEARPPVRHERSRGRRRRHHRQRVRGANPLSRRGRHRARRQGLRPGPHDRRHRRGRAPEQPGGRTAQRDLHSARAGAVGIRRARDSHQRRSAGAAAGREGGRPRGDARRSAPGREDDGAGDGTAGGTTPSEHAAAGTVRRVGSGDFRGGYLWRMAYTVSQRTREIGVRMALGATRGAVVGMVVKNACALVAMGVLAGSTVAWYLSAAAKRFLFGLDATDPRAFAAAVAALALAALVASVVPARRASRVDPMVALRAE